MLLIRRDQDRCFAAGSGVQSGRGGDLGAVSDPDAGRARAILNQRFMHECGVEDPGDRPYTVQQGRALGGAGGVEGSAWAGPSCCPMIWVSRIDSAAAGVVATNKVVTRTPSTTPVTAREPTRGSSFSQ